MRLAARKPCSFGGRKFFIGQEIPEGLVLDAAVQERMGVLTILSVPDSRTDSKKTAPKKAGGSGRSEA